MEVLRTLSILCLLTASVSLGQVRAWVSAHGLDSNPCTRQEPCRNFNAGIATVGHNGEVVALDSAGYGPMNVNYSVMIVSPPGVHAAIAPAAGTAVVISVADGSVILRNLFLNSQGATIGIDMATSSSLDVEACVIRGFTDLGIRFHPSNANSRLVVSDTTIARSIQGISVIGAPNARATLDGLQLIHNYYAVAVNNADVTIRRTVASSTALSYLATQAARVVIDDSVASGGRWGFYADSASRMILTRCVASSCDDYGIFAGDNQTIIYASDCTVSGNANAIGQSAGAQVLSTLNNTLADNPGGFTGTFATQ